MGVLLVTEVTEAAVLALLLAVNAYMSQMRIVREYVGRMRELIQRLQETSVRDSLTGLYNHGYLLKRLQEEINLAQRHQHALSLVILDLNEFKEVNDRHGHLVGDKVLQAIAATIQRQVRQQDVVARYGGDEFCLVLPETDRAAAKKAIARLAAAVGDLAKRAEGWGAITSASAAASPLALRMAPQRSR